MEVLFLTSANAFWIKACSSCPRKETDINMSVTEVEVDNGMGSCVRELHCFI